MHAFSNCGASRIGSTRLLGGTTTLVNCLLRDFLRRGQNWCIGSSPSSGCTTYCRCSTRSRIHTGRSNSTLSTCSPDIGPILMVSNTSTKTTFAIIISPSARWPDLRTTAARICSHDSSAPDRTRAAAPGTCDHVRHVLCG